MITLPGADGATFTKSADYATLAATWPPTGVTKASVGTSEDAQTIYSLTVGDTASKPVVMFVGGIHGDHEWRCPHYVEQFMTLVGTPSGPAKQLLEKIRAHLAVVAIPCANPFGYDNNDYLNANGVNLNRNFDYMWDEYDDSGAPGTKGTAPFSESETQAVKSVFEATTPVWFVDIHTQGSASGGRVETTEVRDDMIMGDLIDSLDLTGGLANDTATVLGQPMGALWAAKSTPPANRRPCIAMNAEPGALETEQAQAEWAVNMMLLVCLYALANFRTRAQRLSNGAALAL